MTLKIKYMLNITLILIISGAFFPEETKASDQRMYQQAKNRYYSVKRSDSRVRRLDRWESAASRLYQVLIESPNGAYAPRAAFLLANLYEHIYKKRDYNNSLERSIYYYNYVADLHRSSSLADDSLMNLGKIYKDLLDDDAKARTFFLQIIDRYPRGDMAPGARSELSPRRIVIKKVPQQTSELQPELQRLSLFKQADKAENLTITVSKQAKSIPLIMLDPGHGGEELGAIGIKGVLEKEVVLNIAEELEDFLVQRMRARVELTRRRDVNIELADRTRMANDHNAAIFISIHANASQTKNARGIETYYLDNTDDKSSLKLARRENQGGAVGGGDLSFMLSDLIQNAKLDDSIALSHYLNNSMFRKLSENYGGIKNLGVKRAPFYVLVGAHMPCSLVEVSFIDHILEGKRLITPQYQALIAKALFEGIRNYFMTTMG